MNTDRTERYLVLFLLLGLSITFAGHGSFVDENLIIQVVESIVTKGNLTVFNMHQALPGPDGEFYSRYGFGFPLMMIPFYIIGMGLDFLVGDHRVFFRAPHMFSLLWGSLLVTVFTGWMMYRLCRAFGSTKRVAVFLSLGLIFGTSFWPYSQTLFRLTAATGCMLVTLWAIVRYEKTTSLRHALIMITSVAFGLNIREDLGIAFVLMGCYCLSRGSVGYRLSAGSFMFVGAFLGCFLWGLHNYIRFETFFIENYADLDFTYPLIISLPELIVGINRGLLVYSPCLLLLLLGFRNCYRAGQGSLWVLCFSILTAYFVLYGKSQFWHGGICFGPRHMYFLLPFALLPAIWWLQNGSAWRLGFAGALFLWGAAVNAVGVYVHTGKHMFFHNAPGFLELWAQPIGHPDYITFDDLNLWWIRMIRQDESGLWLLAFVVLIAATILAGCHLVASLRTPVGSTTDSRYNL